MCVIPDLNSIFEGTKPRDVRLYHLPLARLQQELVESGQAEEAYVVELLTAVSFLPFASNPNEPFGPRDQWLFARRGQLAQLESDIVPTLEGFLPQITDVDLQARVLDFCAYVKRDFRVAGTVVDAYIASAAYLVSCDDWAEALPRLERAAEVALKAGRNNRPYQRLDTTLKSMLEAAALQDSLFASGLIQLMHKNRIGEASSLGATAEEVARRLTTLPEDQRDEFWIQSYWQLGVDAFAGQDEGRADAARAEVARSFEREADRQESRFSTPNLLKAGKLERALGMWRTVKGAEVERERVHKRLLEVQLLGLTELKPIPFTLGQAEKLEEVSQAAKQQLQDKPLFDALTAFALLYRPVPVDILAKEVERELASPLLRLLPNVQMDAFGRTVAIDPADEGGLRLARRLAAATQHQQVVSVMLLYPAYEQLVDDHSPTFEEVLPLTRGHPFVRPGHEVLVAHVILDGLRGLLVQAVHVLLPQLEDGIRYLLETKDVVTSSYRTDGTQADYTLNAMLEDRLAARLTGLLGADQVFDLRALLVSKYGANFRNEALHGRFTSGAFFSPYSLYLWWTYVRLLMLPLVLRSDDDSIAGGTAAASSFTASEV